MHAAALLAQLSGASTTFFCVVTAWAVNAGAWLHGEAVSAGTVMAADMSRRLGWIEPDLYDRTVALLRRAKLPLAPPEVLLPAEPPFLAPAASRFCDDDLIQMTLLQVLIRPVQSAKPGLIVNGELRGGGGVCCGGRA